MNVKELIRLLWQNWVLIVAIGLGTGGVVFLLTTDLRDSFTSEALVSTGVISSFSIESAGSSGARVDRDLVLSELENLTALATAHATIEELATRLLAQYLSQDAPAPGWMSPETFESMQEAEELTPIRALIRSLPNDSAVVATLVEMRESAAENAVNTCIYSDQEYFGIEYLREQLRVVRKGNSDLLAFSYTTNDPALCRRTLQSLLDIFMYRHGELKSGQTSDIVQYFASARAASAQELDSAEGRRLDFRTRNNIINYAEQTRFIAEQKEKLNARVLEERMDYQASVAGVTKLEERLGDRIKVAELNAGLSDKTRELALLNKQMAEYNLLMSGQRSGPQQENRGDIAREIAAVKEEISDYTRQAYELDRSPEGVASTRMLDEWLAVMIASVESRARLDVIENQRSKLDSVFTQYAPWGAELARIDREIELAEDAYLQNLHSYNQAILHRENAKASRLEIMDAPFLPKEGRSSKRLLLLLAGLFGGGLIAITGLIAREFLDESLRNPRIARAVTGLELVAVIPDLKSGKEQSPKMRAAAELGITLLLQQTKVAALQLDQAPCYISLASMLPKEGKSLIGLKLVEALRSEGRRVLYFYPVRAGEEPSNRMLIPAHLDNYLYPVQEAVIGKIERAGVDWESLLDAQPTDFDFVIFEMPGLRSHRHPVSILRNSSLVFLISQTGQQWGGADQQALSLLRKSASCPIRLVLNGAPAPVIREFYGENLFTAAHLETERYAESQ